MALDKVIQAIIENGRREATATIGQARSEAERIVGEARAEGAKLVAAKVEEAEILAKRMAVQETARAEIEAKKAVLKAQKDVMDDVLRTAMKAVGDSRGGSGIEAIMKQLSPELKGAIVYSNARDRDAAERLAGTYGARFGGTMDCLGGIVVESADGSVRMDYRLETTMKDVWTSSVIEVASILWERE